MMRDIAIPVAEALYGTLSGFQAIAREPLRAVRCIYADKCIGRVTFEYDLGLLIVEGNADDDSIEFRFINKANADADGVDVSHLDPGSVSSGSYSVGDGSRLTSRATVMDCFLALMALTHSCY